MVVELFTALRRTSFHIVCPLLLHGELHYYIMTKDLQFVIAWAMSISFMVTNEREANDPIMATRWFRMVMRIDCDKGTVRHEESARRAALSRHVKHAAVS
jgi:hypothetical protein